MTLQEGIEINNNFQNSINLSLDLNHMDKVESYIPTRSSLEILERYLDHVMGDKKEYATILIGPYGKGKSHLLLVLLSLLHLSKNSEKTVVSLLEKIKEVKPQIVEKIEKFRMRKRAFLPVILSHVQEDLNRGFLLALNEALVREKLENLIPATYFSEAVSVIQTWKEQYPVTYETLNQFIAEEGYDTDKFIRSLNRYEKESYELFIRIYPKLTSGSSFRPMINMSAMAIYQSVNEVLCKEYGYAGMFIVFDEFSKYIENHQPENISGDMKILQEMCELANHSDERQIHLTMVAHKSIKEYGTLLPRTVRNSFVGVEGRMTEVPFVTSAKNNYELIENAIKKKKGLYDDYWKGRTGEAEFIEEYYHIAGFSSAFSREDFQRILIKGCFPLTPLAAYFLLHISEKVAQNERTLFTFLSKEEPHSLVWIVRNKGKEEDWLVGMSEIYDYFSSLFRKDTSNNVIHNEWLKTDYALSQVKEKEERAVIKTLALVRMLNMPEEISGNDKVLRLGAHLAEEKYQKAKDNLILQQILCFRSKIMAYDFKNNIGVDIEQEIRKTAGTLFGDISIIEALQKFAGMDFEIPKQYNQNYAMTRFFQYQFMKYEDFLEISKSDYLFEGEVADGKILLLVSEEGQNLDREMKKEAVQSKLKSLNDDRIAVIQSWLQFEEKKLLTRLSAIEYLLQKESFIEQNQIMKEELYLSYEDTLYELNQKIQEQYLPERGNCILYIKGEKFETYEGLSQIQYNRILSKIFEHYYNHTPKINHELVNRNHLSVPIRKARNYVVDALLKQEDFHTFKTGTSPEATIFRATLWHTGLLNESRISDDAIVQIIKQIEEFIKKAEKSKSSFYEIYRVLQGKAFGMRRGVIPIYLAYCFTRFQGMIVIYLKEKEIELNAEALDNINEKPWNYYLCTEKGTAEKTEYIKNLEELFRDYQNSRTEQKKQSRRVTESISRWLRSLPQYTLTFTKPVVEMTDNQLRELCEFRKIFCQQEINPWEVLFTEIPTISKEKKWDYQSVFKKIAFWKEILDGYIAHVKQTTAEKIKQIFDCKKEEDLAEGLKIWYQKIEKQAERTLYQTTTNHFLNYIQEIPTHNEEEIVSRISKILLDVFIEDWNDDSMTLFLEVLKGAKEEIEESNREKTEKNSSCKILLDNGTGKIIEKYYKKEEENLNHHFFRNTLMDLLEDVGESVELEQKVAILADVLRSLLTEE